MPVLGLPGVVGMPGAKRFCEMIVVGTSLVFISDKQRNRCAGSFTLKNATQHLKGIGFLSLRHNAALTGPAPVEFVLYKC